MYTYSMHCWTFAIFNTGGLDIECSLVSTLAFLKHQKTLPPAVVLDQVSKSIGKADLGKGRREVEEKYLFPLLNIYLHAHRQASLTE